VIRHRQVQAGDAVSSMVDGKATLLEVLGNHLGDVAVIFDQQQVGRDGFSSQVSL